MKTSKNATPYCSIDLCSRSDQAILLTERKDKKRNEIPALYKTTEFANNKAASLLGVIKDNRLI